MEAFESIYKAIDGHPTAALLALALLALGWLLRDSRKRDSEHAAELAALNKQHLEAMQAANAAHLQTALQVAPLAAKLVTCVEVLERLSNAALARGGTAQ